MLYYDEVFTSIQGETTDAGLPTVFIRLYGCNVKCSYCDQAQQPPNRKRISAENLVSLAKAPRIKNICITGGEPLIQQEIYSVIYDLVASGHNVAIETNGCIEIQSDPYIRSFKYIMDIKCPSSGVSHKNIYSNLSKLHFKDEIVFVIANREDYDFAKSILKKYSTQAKVLFSPMFDKDQKQHIGKDLVNWLIEDRLDNIRVQIQMHKIIGVC